MRSKKSATASTRRFQLTFLLFSLGYILLGALRIWIEDPANMLICYLLGGLALVGGLVRVAFFFVKTDATRIFRNDLAVGTLLLFAGIFCILKPGEILQLLPVVLGFGILFDSVLKMEYSFHLRRVVFRGWGVLAVLATLSAVCGVLLVLGSFHGTTLHYFLGGALIYDGILNLLTILLLAVVLRRRKNGAVPAKKAKSTAETPVPVQASGNAAAGETETDKAALADIFSAPDGETTEGGESLFSVLEGPDGLAGPLRGPASPTMEEENAAQNGPGNG